MIKLKQLLLEKTLYHGTTVDNARQIEKYGLIPQTGDFVDQAYGGDYEEAGLELPELTFAADKGGLDRAVTAATHHVAKKLNKDFHDVTDSEFVHHAAIIKMHEADYDFKHRPEGDENYYGQHPPTVEPGDYYSDEGAIADEVLTGNAMVRLLKRYNLWPRGHMFQNEPEDIAQKRNTIIKYILKKYPERSRDTVIKQVMGVGDKYVDGYFQRIRRELTETRTIEPDASLLVGDITLYHGTTLEVAKKARQGELGPVDTRKLIIPILVNRYNETPQRAEEIYKKYIHSYRRKVDPNVLFLTTKKEQAVNYAKYTATWGGEIVYDVLKNYFIERHFPAEAYTGFEPVGEPAVITLTVPLSMVFTHPHWKTPLRDRLLSSIRKSRHWNTQFDFNMEVFVYEKIPAKYVQRIDKI